MVFVSGIWDQGWYPGGTPGDHQYFEILVRIKNIAMNVTSILILRVDNLFSPNFN